GEFALLDHAVLGDHHDELVGDKVLDAEERLHALIALQVDEVRDVLSLARHASVGNLISLQPIDPSAGGEDQHVAVRGCHQQVLHEILTARAHTDAALAAARLAPVGIDGGALEISAARNRNRNVLHGDEIFELDLAGVFDDFGAARVAEILLDLFEFLDD